VETSGASRDLVFDCARTVRARLAIPTDVSPVGVVLGSGLGALADKLAGARAVGFADLPGFPRATVQGHKGRVVFGELSGVPLLALQGRLHGYEGHDAATVAFPARVFGVLGVRALIVTNAAGGVNASFHAGDLMRITDHLNLTGRNPLIGPHDERFGERFPDLTRAYDPRLATALEEAAKRTKLTLRAGVYVQLNGPSYETPAEIRMLRTLGADAVGMSTVPEVIVAAQMNVPVAGISCITNLAAGISEHSLSHEEVIEVAKQVEGKFLDLLETFIPLASSAVPPRAPTAP
jgi:purine-nucleoside phosphorylase